MMFDDEYIGECSKLFIGNEAEGLATSQTPLSPLRIENWNERYQKELGNLRAFLESKTVHPSFFGSAFAENRCK